MRGFAGTLSSYRDLILSTIFFVEPGIARLLLSFEFSMYGTDVDRRSNEDVLYC